MQILNYERLLKLGMWLAIAIGAYARLVGLGAWPLAIDEYFIVQSVDNIIRHGVPAYDCGGYYMRGITLQYLIAPLFWLGLNPEFSARLVTVAFSFALLAAVYFLGKRLSGVAVACVSVALLSISLWEIEFARFARMYMPFQFIFICYLLALHRVVVDRKSAAHGWLWLLSLAGVITWAGGVFLLAANFVPGLIERTPVRARHLAVNVGVLLVGYFYTAWNFRYMGGQPPLPPDVSVAAEGGGIIGPPLLASTLSLDSVWMPGALAVLGVSLVTVVFLLRAPRAVRERIAWAAAVVLSYFNLFGCVLIGLTLALLLRWIDLRRASLRSMFIALPAIAVNFGFWVAYALFTDAPRALFPGFGAGGELSKLAVVLFKYPDVFDSILFPWLAAVPVLAGVLGGLLVLAVVWVIWAVNDEHLSGLRLMLVVCLIMAALVGVTSTLYATTRYTFFLLPVLYLVAVMVIDALILRPVRSRPTRGLALGLAVLGLVVVTEDFGWSHMVHIDRMEWNYRLPYDEARSKHYYARHDYRTPAQYVNREARPNDVIMITKLPVAPYLKRTDYVYSNFRWTEFPSISCEAGRTERWTGSPLLYRQTDLFNVIDRVPGDVWLITKQGWDLPPENALKQSYSIALVYSGTDSEMGVYKIDHSR